MCDLKAIVYANTSRRPEAILGSSMQCRVLAGAIPVNSPTDQKAVADQFP